MEELCLTFCCLLRFRWSPTGWEQILVVMCTHILKWGARWPRQDLQRECEHTGPASPGPLHTCLSCTRGVEVNWEGSWSGFVQRSRTEDPRGFLRTGCRVAAGDPGAASARLLLICPWAWSYGGSAGPAVGVWMWVRTKRQWHPQNERGHPSHPRHKENSILPNQFAHLAPQVQLRAEKGSALCLGAACLLGPGNQRRCTCGCHPLGSSGDHRPASCLHAQPGCLQDPKMMASTSLPPSASCTSFVLWPTLAQNHRGRGILGKMAQEAQGW